MINDYGRGQRNFWAGSALEALLIVMAARRDTKDQCGAGSHKQIPLTDEEKAVLLECRRNSIFRGLPLGIGTVLGLRYLMRRGSLPGRLQRWPFLLYTGGFLFTFMAGVSSYKDECMRKIMALENSVIADQIRLAKKKGFEHLKDCQLNNDPQSPPSVAFDGERGQGVPENKPLFKEQPQVFSNTSSSVSNDQVKRRKGRTFDEIREENRRQQIQQAYPQTQQWMERQERQAEPEKQNRDKEIGVPGTGRTPRRNKYGDLVYDE